MKEREGFLDYFTKKNNAEGYHALAKEEVMSEEEIKLTDDILTVFQDSYQEKVASGYFDMVNKNWEYWLTEKTEIRNEVTPISDTNILHAYCESFVSNGSLNKIDSIVMPTSVSEKNYVNPVRIVLEHIKENNSPVHMQSLAWRDIFMQGMAGYLVLWNSKAGENGLPIITPVDMSNVYVDSAVSNIRELHDGRFLIYVTVKSIDEAREKFPDVCDAISPNYIPSCMRMSDEEYNKFSNSNSISDVYIHMHVFKKEDGKMRYIQQSACGVLFEDSVRTDIPQDRYPLFVCAPMISRQSKYPKTIAETLINSQDIINDFDEQLITNARLTGNPVLIYETASGYNPENNTNEPGISIPVHDKNGLEWMIPPSMPNYILQRRSNAFEEAQVTSRMLNQMMGMRQKGVDTATEAMALQQNGMTSIDSVRALNEETLSEAFSYAFELVRTHWKGDVAFRLTDDASVFVWFNAQDLEKLPKYKRASKEFQRAFAKNNPKAELPTVMMDESLDGGKTVTNTKSAKFDIRIKIGAGLPENKAFRYNIVKESYINKSITIREYRRFLRDYLAMTIDTEEEEQIVRKLEVREQLELEALKAQAMQAQQGGAAGGNQSPDVMGLDKQNKANPALIAGANPAIQKGGANNV